MVSIPQEDPWNIQCSICGHKWHTQGRLLENINCSKCQDSAKVEMVIKNDVLPWTPNN